MNEEKIRLAQELFLLAEDFNREGYDEHAFNLKGVCFDFSKELNKQEYQEVTDFLDSVGA